uniref:Uncharacterized protein n=1 Tax=Rhizophora mucronata TaxID=61149 RepID=A0A2P2NWJ9_RHIMU
MHSFVACEILFQEIFLRVFFWSKFHHISSDSLGLC